MDYNPKYFHSGCLHSLSPKRESLWHHICSDGTIIGFFQGHRGTRPDIDFKIKILLTGSDKRMFTPNHWDWAVDLLIKSHFYPKEVADILDYFIDFYDNRCVPFATQVERNCFMPQAMKEIANTFSYVSVDRTLPIDALALLIELFCYNEKSPTAHQFRDGLLKMKDYCLGKVSVNEVLNLMCSHF